MNRPYIRTSTEWRIKWFFGHSLGCVFHAPWWKCICNEIRREFEESRSDTEELT